MKERILVTGGAGFIGSCVDKLLLDSGYDVVVVDDLSSGYRSLVPKGCQFIKASISDFDVISQALEGVKFVIHLAATSYIEATIKDPLACYKNNLSNGLVLLEAMRRASVNKIIFSSTAAVYGDQKEMPIEEDVPKLPLQPYGASKLGFEQVLSAYFYCYKINSVSLRYFNAYGPCDEQKPQTRAVPLWCRATALGKSIPLYWKGKQIRDYVFVEDIARAHIAVKELKGVHVYNIGHGKGIEMNDILKNIFRVAGKKIEVIDKGERLGDPMKLVANTSRIRKEVGWGPKISLEDGIRTTYQYYKDHDGQIV